MGLHGSVINSPDMWINMESWRVHLIVCTDALISDGECPKDSKPGDVVQSRYYPARHSTFLKQIAAAKPYGSIGTYEVSGIFQKSGGTYRFKNKQRTQFFYRVRVINLIQKVFPRECWKASDLDRAKCRSFRDSNHDIDL